MYRTIIKFKEETPIETLKKLKQICDKVHDDYLGKVPLIKDDGLNLIYESSEEDLVCALHLGSHNLFKEKLFREWIDIWRYEDDIDPSGNGDYLPEYLEAEKIFRNLKI